MTGERVSISAAAERLGVSRKMVRRMYKDGTLAGTQPRSKIFIDLASLEAYLAEDERRREAARKLRESVRPKVRRPPT